MVDIEIDGTYREHVVARFVIMDVLLGSIANARLIQSMAISNSSPSLYNMPIYGSFIAKPDSTPLQHSGINFGIKPGSAKSHYLD